MTDKVPVDDRELEQYLEGGSRLSARYREASAEATPPELDEIILARARAEARRKPPSLNRVFAPVALAASLVLAVNLAWNLYEVEKPEDRPPAAAERDVAAPAPAAPQPVAEPAPEPRRKAAPPPAPVLEERLEREAQRAAAQREQQAAAKDELEQVVTAERRAKAEAAPQAMPQSADAAGAAAPAAPAEAAPLTEGQKIDRLLAYVGGLEGAVFIRNGKEYGPAEAAKHLAYKREKAGDRVKTANDFIRVCASHSYLSGEAYLIRLMDGRTRTAEDVLREELSRIEGR